MLEYLRIEGGVPDVHIRMIDSAGPTLEIDARAGAVAHLHLRTIRAGVTRIALVVDGEPAKGLLLILP
jgi:hypothetical protein